LKIAEKAYFEMGWEKGLVSWEVKTMSDNYLLLEKYHKMYSKLRQDNEAKGGAS
jgi:hypothetical protein